MSAGINTIKFLWANRQKCKTQVQEWSNYPNLVFGLMVLVGLLFPMHFTSFGAFASRKQCAKLEQKKRSLLKQVRNIPIDNLEKQFFKLDLAIEDSKNTHLEFLHLTNQNLLLETMVDNFPSSILMICIWILSLSYPQLSLFLSNTFRELFSDSFQWIVGLVTAKTASNAIFSALRIRYIYNLVFIHLHGV